MDRIEQGIASTIAFTFTNDGQPVDPDDHAAAITVTHENGLVIQSGAAAEPTDDVGKFEFTLLPPDVMALGRLTFEWTAAIDGIAQTFTDYIEIAGGFYFTIAEFLDEYPDLASAPFAKIAKKRKSAEDRIEKLVNFAGVPRAKRVSLSGDGNADVLIPVRYLRRVLAGSIGADPLDLTTVVVDGYTVQRELTWPRGTSNISLLVEHGLDTPPEALREAAMMLTEHLLTPTPLDERTTAIQGGDGRIELLATPGRHGSLTGIPEVDVRISDEALDPISWVAIR